MQLNQCSERNFIILNAQIKKIQQKNNEPRTHLKSQKKKRVNPNTVKEETKKDKSKH